MCERTYARMHNKNVVEISFTCANWCGQITLTNLPRINVPSMDHSICGESRSTIVFVWSVVHY